MLFIDFFQWWYSQGWKQFVLGLIGKLRSAADFFSFGLLIRTLFSPFRQISANQYSEGSLDMRFRDFLDRLLSRIIGAIVRLAILITGSILFVVELVISLVLAILWPFLPLAPVCCLVCFFMGVHLP
ncbi:hypothetical protein IKF15_01310 [Candidatus Saccharibacteria bacterium]|nr:hypothetical protein [Candidatus Saccharibacteria bacterium]